MHIKLVYKRIVCTFLDANIVLTSKTQLVNRQSQSARIRSRNFHSPMSLITHVFHQRSSKVLINYFVNYICGTRKCKTVSRRPFTRHTQSKYCRWLVVIRGRFDFCPITSNTRECVWLCDKVCPRIFNDINILSMLDCFSIVHPPDNFYHHRHTLKHNSIIHNKYLWRRK